TYPQPSISLMRKVIAYQPMFRATFRVICFFKLHSMENRISANRLNSDGINWNKSRFFSVIQPRRAFGFDSWMLIQTGKLRWRNFDGKDRKSTRLNSSHV